LIEAAPGMRPGEQRQPPHPTHEVRPVLVHRQILVLQELGVTIEHLERRTIAFGPMPLPFYPDLCNT